MKATTDRAGAVPRPARLVMLVLIAVVLVACNGASETTTPSRSGDDAISGPPSQPDLLAADPAGPGPFGVGSWESVVDHTALDGSPEPLPLLVWYPTDLGSGVPSGARPFPLVVFSHGASSRHDGSTFLTEHLASHGFVVAAVQHPVRPISERADAFANRPGEVHAAVDFVLAESVRPGALLEDAVDADRLGVMGHSFGGLTTVALLGETDGRFAAGLAIAPGIRANDPADVSDDLQRIEAPMMLMMGEQDTLARHPDLIAGYATIPGSTQRYAFVLPNGTHLSFSDTCGPMCPQGSPDHAEGHALITTYGTAFLQVHVAGLTDFAGYLETDDDIGGGAARLFEGDL